MRTDTLQDPRIKKRLSCDLFFDGGRHAGFVLNVSRSGLFVQTSVTAQPGANVAINLNGPSGENLEVDATVVWQRIDTSQPLGLERAGVGLQINRASPGYLEFLENIGRPRTRTPFPKAVLNRYQVRVKLSGEPRSRTLTVFAKSEEAAGRQALQKAGDDWSVIELEEQPLG